MTFPTSTLPTDNDVKTFLQSVGIVFLDTYDFSGSAERGYLEWQSLTNRHPFLSTGASQTRVFNPPGFSTGIRKISGGGQTLWTDPGLVSISSVVVSGNTFVSGQDYYGIIHLGSGPVDCIKFVRPIFGERNSISITGVWGYSSTVNAEVWNQILRLGAATIIPDILTSIGTSPDRIRTTDKEISLRTSESSLIAANRWAEDALRIARRYQLRSKPNAQ